MIQPSKTIPDTCPVCNNVIYSSSQWSPFTEMCYRCEDDLYNDGDDYLDSDPEEDD